MKTVASLLIFFGLVSLICRAEPDVPKDSKKSEQPDGTEKTQQKSTPADADSVATKPPAEVKYKAGKEVNFEELLIQGQIKRAEVSVVTGDTGQGNEGLLRLRENFVDQMSMDAGEQIQ